VQTKNKTMIENGFILSTKILVKPEEIKEKTSAGGLILPNVRKAPQISGVVIKRGEVPLTGTYTTVLPHNPINEGQTVLFYERSAQPVQIDGQDLLLLDFREVLFYF